MEPATTIVASTKPNDCLKEVACCGSFIISSVMRSWFICQDKYFIFSDRARRLPEIERTTWLLYGRKIPTARYSEKLHTCLLFIAHLQAIIHKKAPI